jgi:hypothetical protein
MALTIESLVHMSHQNAVNKGFWGEGALIPEIGPDDRNIPEMLALVHSEISEALEVIRAGDDIRRVDVMTNGKPEGFFVELADAIIRIADLAGRYIDGQTFEDIVLQKMAYNETRPHKHGKAF